MKALTLTLNPLITSHISKNCIYLAGNGGNKKAVRETQKALPENHFVSRSDVKGYYAYINHKILYNQLTTLIDDQKVLILLKQYMEYTSQFDGIYRDNKQTILRCCLSPLMAALHLIRLDNTMEKLDVFYKRYMDN